MAALHNRHLEFPCPGRPIQQAYPPATTTTTLPWLQCDSWLNKLNQSIKIHQMEVLSLIREMEKCVKTTVSSTPPPPSPHCPIQWVQWWEEVHSDQEERDKHQSQSIKRTHSKEINDKTTGSELDYWQRRNKRWRSAWSSRREGGRCVFISASFLL